MIFIGDVHGYFEAYADILKTYNTDQTLQLGDLGIGFPFTASKIIKIPNAGWHKFIRGNHDNPAACRDKKAYAGDSGFFISDDFLDGITRRVFYISGAQSLDRNIRTPELDWWKDEELSDSEMEVAISVYRGAYPDIVCSHDCPKVAYDTLKLKDVSLFGDKYHQNRTSLLLDELYKIHQPQTWLFGHHHTSRFGVHENTKFICLDELETRRL